MAGTLRDPGAQHAVSAEAAAAGPPPSPSLPSPLAQYLSLDAASLGEPRHSRHGELRRALQADDHLPDELRRIRHSLADSSLKAREKARSLQESLQKLDRYKNMVTRKRQRSDPGGGGAPSGALRMGAQNNPVGMSKRVRSSLADGRLEGRGNVPTRQGPLVNNEKSSPVEKEKSSARTSGTTSGLSEDKLRGLSTGGEGWEKKLKRKRSVGTMLNRGNDADRDVKPVRQHRPANEARPRSGDNLAYRHGASAGALAGSKMDVSPQQNFVGPHILGKTDVDCATIPNERRERHAGIEKERTMVKGIKTHTSEDIQTGSIGPLPKSKACRAPRTSSLVMGSSPSLQRSTGEIDELEETLYSNKASPLGGTTNRKRSTHSNASSPPIAWVGQRSQKMSRTRRANIVSPVSNFDEVLSEGSPLDIGTAVRSASIEAFDEMLTKNGTSNNTRIIPKVANMSSPVGLSESEGPGATETMTKEKVTNSAEVDNKGANAYRTGAGLIFSSNKNTVPLKEGLGDGCVRRQGRSGRGTVNAKGCSTVSKENLDAADTRKPLKGARPGPEKNDSKVGRSPVKKGSEHRSSSCYTQAFNFEPEDDREELLAAANAARSSIVGAYSGPFWKKMEPMLTFTSPDNLSFLKNQINIVEELDMSMSCMPDGEHNVIASTDYSRQHTVEVLLSQMDSSLLPEQGKTNGVGTKGPINYLSPSEENHCHGPQKVEAGKWLHEMVPMAHRLLSALIMEDDFSDSNAVQRDILVEFSNSHIPCTANKLENELEASARTSNFGSSMGFTHSNNTSVVHQSRCNGFTASGSFISSNNQNSIRTENCSDGFNVAVYSDNGPFHNLIPQISAQCQNSGKSFSSSPYEDQYGQMSLNDKIFIELQSIGICLETVPELDDGDDENINKNISVLRKRLHDQVKQKKFRLTKLDKAIEDTKNIEERSLEQHAMNKLVERAYQKLKGGRVGTSHKTGVSKSANMAANPHALAFAKRTLARCQRFEETKKSCFSEPSLWSVLSAPLPSSDAKSTEERLKLQKLNRNPLDQGGTKWKKSDREREQNRAKGSGTKSGRHSSGSGRSGERRNKTKTKQKIVQISSSGNLLGRVVESLPTQVTQQHPEPAIPSGAKVTQQHPEPAIPSGGKITQQHPELAIPSGVKNPQHPRNPPAQAAPRPTGAALANLPGLDDILDVAGGLDGQANDISTWFTDELEESQDFDFSGALECPDDDLSQLAFI